MFMGVLGEPSAGDHLTAAEGGLNAIIDETLRASSPETVAGGSVAQQLLCAACPQCSRGVLWGPSAVF